MSRYNNTKILCLYLTISVNNDALQKYFFVHLKSYFASIFVMFNVVQNEGSCEQLVVHN